VRRGKDLLRNFFVLSLLLGILMRSVSFQSALSSSLSEFQAQEISLPIPSGPYSVGTVTYYWVDRTREEQWTPKLNDYRQLAVQFWYPARKGNPERETPYIPDLQRLRASLDQYWPNRPYVRTHATRGASLSPARRRYPIIVFSHGMNSARFDYTALLEELASHGYVVAAIDHTYWGPGVAFPNGKTVRLEDGMIARDDLSSHDTDRIMQQGITVMADDQNFVAEKLAELNGRARGRQNLFRHRLDLSRIGVMGHSMGGMAATRACLEFTAFKNCVSLDGPNYFMNLMPTKSSKPFLLLLNSDWGLSVPEKIKTIYLEAWSDPVVAIIHGTKHDSFSDLPLTKRLDNAAGLIAPARAHNIISAYCLAFFDKNLKGTPTTLFNRSSEKFPEVEFVDLKTLSSAVKPSN
jgi:dienelactone hydrolase